MDGMVGRVSARGHAGHCDAYRWLIERHDQILQMLSDHKPSWRVVADALAEEGVTGARGQRLTGERLRQMWQRVSRDKAKAATAGGPVDPQRERRAPCRPAGRRRRPIHHRHPHDRGRRLRRRWHLMTIARRTTRRCPKKSARLSEIWRRISGTGTAISITQPERIDIMNDKACEEGERRPVLLIAVGRQRVGKTAFLNTTAQYLRHHGAGFRIWNADKLNRSSSLSLFHDDVMEPPSPDPEDVKGWLEERFADLIQHRYDAFLDIGGGTTPLSTLIEEVRIVTALERQGIRLVLVHVVGPELADLDYLERYLADSLLAPEATVIVLNGGLVLTGRSAGFAFAGVSKHRALMAALKKGAKVILMPRLACMSAVVERGLGFVDAMSGVPKPRHHTLSFLDQERVAIWWERELPKFFALFPALWLPAADAASRVGQDARAVTRGKQPGPDDTGSEEQVGADG
jgi:hypothetical protein